MSDQAPLLRSEVSEILEEKKAIQFDDLLREVRKTYSGASERDIMSVLIKLEIMGLIVTTRLSKKNLRIELLRARSPGTD